MTKMKMPKMMDIVSQNFHAVNSLINIKDKSIESIYDIFNK